MLGKRRLLVALPLLLLPYQSGLSASSSPKPVAPVDYPAVFRPIKATDVEPVERVSPLPTPVYTPTPVATPQATPAQPMGDAKAFIYAHESGNNPGAINASSGACGLGQALPCSKMPCALSDYACQDGFFTTYMLARYGTWEVAKAFWLAHSWW